MNVEELRIYPIKSCGGVKVQEALITRYGLALPSDPRIYDRRWMIVKDGRHLSQRVLPSMALIQPSFVKNGLLLQAPNMPDLFISVNPLPKEIMHCYCWDDPILGLRYDNNISNWFRTYFQSDDKIDLVIFDEKQFQARSSKNKPDFPNVAQDHDVAVYHDICLIHLCSIESVANLNTRLDKKIKIYNFRPNIIVTNGDVPYSEDCWREIQIGEVKLRWISPCLRCLLPTVDQETGIKDLNQEPWKTLRSYRLKPNSYGIKALFGIYLGQIDDSKIISGTIHVGDSIHVTKQELDFWGKSD
ncbi:unnamed protein product [Rotaria sp. Silwood2]|nr:unnamed protein product [Rotaria sp. Silwood2]CAF2944677.1 unnamed protein product [Rotaria sp. Silwood2]CAF3906301.1 unnamed protein product [Rotaria sp. Silwood2]CAF4478918.1 unnamed protein product [Rotaria sp. Silwood2]